MMPRWVHKAYARANGYFWLPCPRCGHYFGGHEVYGYPPVLVNGHARAACCPPLADNEAFIAVCNRVTWR